MIGTANWRGMVSTILAKTITTLENFSSVVLLAMVLLTFADVIGRYLLSAPIFGASEMVSGMLAMLIFAGLGVTNARDQHIVVELIDKSIRDFSPKIYDTAIQVFSAVVMSIITFVLSEEAIEAYQLDSVTFVLQVPLYYVTGIVAILSGVSVVTMLAGIILRRRIAAITQSEEVI